MIKTLEIYTDGACKGNPGVGGWGAYLRYGQHELKLKGAEQQTTNNRMELQAAISALQVLKRPCPIILTTDSQYLRKGITKWLSGWKRNGWKTAKKEPVKNVDLWRELDQLSRQYQIQWNWIKGHSGHQENEMADYLANMAINELMASAAASAQSHVADSAMST